LILLDTHVLIWAVLDSPRLGTRARRLIADSPNRFVSSLSHVEIAVKRAKGKLPLPADFSDQLPSQMFEELPFSTRHAAGVRDLIGQVVGDPFDWMLLAQSRVDGLTLVTADENLLQFSNTVDATE
jgi:PIN domain nuclease of toxin-antitoxin system